MVQSIPADLSLPAEREELFKKFHKDRTGVDILINNAGFGWYGFIHRIPQEIFRQMIAVNVETVVH